MDDFYDGFVCDECHQIHEACRCGENERDELQEHIEEMKYYEQKEAERKAKEEPQVVYYYQTK